MISTKFDFQRALSFRLRVFAAISSRLTSQAAAAPNIHSEKLNDKHPLLFDRIPGPRGKLTTAVSFYRHSEGFRKFHKLTLKLFKEYGPIFKEDVTEKTPVVHIMEPNDFETVYRAEGKYPKRAPINFFLKYQQSRGLPIGIAQLNGEEWQRIRQALAPKVMRPKVIEENIDNFNAVTKDAIHRLVKIRDVNGEVPDLEGELSKWSTEGGGTFVFDTRLGLYEDPPNADATKYIKAIFDLFENGHRLFFGILEKKLLPYVETPSYKNVCSAMDTMNEIGGIFVQRKKQELERMAEKQDDSQKEKVVSVLSYMLAKTKLSVQEITENALTVLGGGVDTLRDWMASNTGKWKKLDKVQADVGLVGRGSCLACFFFLLLCSGREVNRPKTCTPLNQTGPYNSRETATSALWVLYNVARHPEVQENLHQEVTNVLGKDGDVTAGSLAKLSYVKACVKESARLTPVVALNRRQLPIDVVLSGYLIPAETIIQLNFYATGVCERHFKNASEYKPERWLRENKKEIHPFAFLPFGYGPRMCIGSRVAELEMHLLLAKVIQRFRLEYHHEPLDLYQKFVAGPEKPVRINFIERH